MPSNQKVGLRIKYAEAVALGLDEAANYCSTDQADLKERFVQAAATIREAIGMIEEARFAAELNAETIKAAGRDCYTWEEQMRFWGKVKTGEEDACWEWTAYRNPRGYGLFLLRGVQTLASRAAWLLTRGAIPKDHVVCHRCDNPPCVNPHHLWIGTDGDNVRDAATKGRLHGQLKTHCPQGHPYDEANTYWEPGFVGRRACKTCRYKRMREFYLKHRKLKRAAP